MAAGAGLTGTFFCVTATTESFPLTAMLVIPDVFTALKAYSAVRSACVVSAVPSMVDSRVREHLV